MGALMRSFDWSSTLLGPVSSWPQSLRTSVSTCLNSKFAILIWWGPDLVMLYNDAYRDIIGAKHPAALGRPGRECWPEIWPTIQPMLEGVLQLGEATWSNDLLLPLERSGYPEECYFTFSYSPIRDESGGVAGVFTPVVETTDHVIGQRQMRTLRDLASRASGARDVKAACEACAKTLAENPYSIPFAALYLFDESRSSATLAGSAGLDAGSLVAPKSMAVARMPEMMARAAKSPEMTVIDDLEKVVGPLPNGPWGIPTRTGVILPILMPGKNPPLGFVLAGVNPLKRLDPAFLTFFELVGGHISAAVAHARAYQEQRERTRALAEIDRAKTAFFSNVSHEFRTPLTLMLGPIEAMLERARLPEGAGGEELRLVHRNGMRLLKMVNTLLDFSRIEAGRVQALYEPTDLATLTAEIASAFRSAMERAGLEFVIDCPPLAEPAYIDREMWEKIILNLVSNAFKFTLAGSIAIRLKDLGNRLELSVEDTGIGVPENELSRIFDRFHRVEGARGRTHEGTGIGLALVQELSKLQGGFIRVESTVGRGSAFIVTVPKGSAHLPAERLASGRTISSTAVAASAYVNEALRWLPEAERPSASAPSFAADTVQAPHLLNTSGRILLVDDNADMREYVRRLLGEYYQIEAVGNGLQALAAAREHPPDLILTDVMMPELDGFGLLSELRASEATRTIPVILLSARAGEDARVEGLAAGADDYIVKPFTARELLARVSAHLSLNRLRIEAADRERALRAEGEAAHERVAVILESISDAFLAFDDQWRFTYVNTEAERTMGMTRDELMGRVLWDVFPETRGTDLETQFQRAMAERVVIRLENYYRPWQRWFEVRIYPAKNHGMSVFYQDISKRKQTEEAMDRANAALRAANLDLEQFAYSASHDLREPLRTVRTHCELLKRNYSDKLDARADALIEYCVDGAARMNVLIDDLLAYVQASTEIATPLASVSLQSALAEALRNLEAPITETGAAIRCDAMPVLRVAPVHARQLFQNLIGNALKYRSAAPPAIHVGARQEAGSWIISVQDNGMGIAPEYREKIFELGQRLHPASKYPGTGIGLAICRKLVERYGGRIWVDSELGKGATFSFSIPEHSHVEERQGRPTSHGEEITSSPEWVVR